jgi:hypothetical protein
MEDMLQELERKRKELYKELSKIGDFRTGSISVNYRKCGKENCKCSKQDHPGHGPRYLWSTTIKGKSYSKHLKFGPELQKYEDEIENYKRFLNISDALVKVNEKICTLKPVVELEDGNDLERLKKKLQRHLSKKYREKLIK